MGLLFFTGKPCPPKGYGRRQFPFGGGVLFKKEKRARGAAPRAPAKKSPQAGGSCCLLVHVVYQGQELLGGDLGPVDGVVRLWGGAGVDEVHAVAV